MSSIRIITADSDTTSSFSGCVADNTDLETLSKEKYLFYKGVISQSTRAAEEDFFAEDVELIAVKPVNRPLAPYAVYIVIALFAASVVYSVVVPASLSPASAVALPRAASQLLTTAFLNTETL